MKFYWITFFYLRDPTVENNPSSNYVKWGLRSESIPKNLFPKMYAKETMIFFFDHISLSFIILLIRIIVISPY